MRCLVAERTADWRADAKHRHGRFARRAVPAAACSREVVRPFCAGRAQGKPGSSAAIVSPAGPRRVLTTRPRRAGTQQARWVVPPRGRGRPTHCAIASSRDHAGPGANGRRQPPAPSWPGGLLASADLDAVALLVTWAPCGVKREVRASVRITIGVVASVIFTHDLAARSSTLGTDPSRAPPASSWPRQAFSRVFVVSGRRGSWDARGMPARTSNGEV